MPELFHKAAELQRWFDEDRAAKRKEAGGRLANRLNELLKDGLPWPAAEREALAQLAEAVYYFNRPELTSSMGNYE